MRKIDFQTKASANRNKNKEEEYIRGAASMGFVFLVGKILEIYYYFQGGGFKSDDIALKICELITMLICTILIGIIAYNIKRKQVFIKANARLVQFIGWVVVASSIAIPMISKNFVDIHYIVSYPLQYLMLLGFFIVAIGYVFQLAIKMREEQDLTI
jgi:hypothetical protein